MTQIDLARANLSQARKHISPEFDVDYYLSQFKANMVVIDPVAHYFERGWRELRDPSRYFSTTFYLNEYPDVRASGINPFLHYIVRGRDEGRFANPVDPRRVDAQLKIEMAVAKARFDEEFYLEQAPELRELGSEAILRHFVEKGWRTMLDPAADFSTELYLERNSDVRGNGMNPLIHYLVNGRLEGRPCFPSRKLRKKREVSVVTPEPELAPAESTWRGVDSNATTVLPESKLSSIEGRVDALTSWGASGWVWTPLEPERALKIETYYNGRMICSASASELRLDVKESGRGTGKYGFTLRFVEKITGETPLTIIAICPDETKTLARLYLTDSGFVDAEQEHENNNTATPDSENISTSGLDSEGAVDELNRWGASGWVWRPSTPDQALEVEALLSGEVIGRTLADQLRPDLVGHKGTGRYGFVLSFSRPLENEIAPILRVLGPEGPYVIPGQFKVQFETNGETRQAEPETSEGLIPTGIVGYVDQMTRRDAVGWAWFPAAPEQTVRVEAVLDGKLIGSALANQRRPDLLEHHTGTGLYGFHIKFDEVLTGSDAPQIRGLPARGQPLSYEMKLPPATADDLIQRAKGSILEFFDEHAVFTSKGPMFEEFDETIVVHPHEFSNEHPKPLLIAFYLPQFHAIEENDDFWGKGFTEWRQLAKGIPRFPGHYQPRIPRDLGFYNLESIDALRAQAALAKAGGIHGFAYYYYWFNQKRLLERPLEKLLESDVDMPFMLIWANENWTRTWDGSDSQILVKQDYDADDEDALLDDLSRHFLDRRYIRIQNRPLFVIYKPENIPDSAVTIGRWRRKLTTRLGVEPLIFMAQTFGDHNPGRHGLDGAIEFPPHKLSNELPGRPTPDAYSPNFAGRVIAYDDFVKASLDEDDPEFPLIKTIVPSWDNDARRPNRGLTLEGLSPRKYQDWLYELITRAMDAPILGTPIVGINAWNEWAESAYLEPDVYFGAAYLNATARAYASAVKARCSARSESDMDAVRKLAVTVILPNYNHEKYLRERLQSVLDQTLPPDEIIFLDDCSSDNSVAIAREILAKSSIPFRIVENDKNSGGVFRQWMKGLSLARNELIWIAETDDSVDRRFLSNILPAFTREDVMAAFGRISCIDQDGAARNDLDHYFDDLENFSWNYSCVVPSHRAFSHDFSVKNVIPNASGLVFRKPVLTDGERNRLFEYRFAGDWYFYALVARGGSIAYCRRARSFFRVNQSSASRSSFFTERHLTEHKMVIRDLRREYGIGDEAINAHCEALAPYMQDYSSDALKEAFRQHLSDNADLPPIRICIAANGFAVGGGEILPVELANTLKGMGVHVTYLVIERPVELRDGQIRKRLRPDIPVVYWDAISDDFAGFIKNFGIQLINSHNVSVDFRVFLGNIDLKIPYVVSLHGGYETVPDLLTPDFLDYLSKNVKKWLYLAKRNFAFLPSEACDPQKLLYSFNALPAYQGEWVNRDEFRSQHHIAADAFVFVLCSRAIEAKGWRTAIAIAKTLSERKEPPVHLVLIGDGPIAAELRAEYEVAPFVTFLGQVNSPVRYFKCFDMGIFPTQFEGETFPLFLLECFQVGLPAITTDIGEIPRMMEATAGHAPGILVDHRSKPKKLGVDFVTKLQKMFDSPNTYANYRVGALATSERFSIEGLGELYRNAFQDLLLGQTDTMATKQPAARSEARL